MYLIGFMAFLWLGSGASAPSTAPAGMTRCWMTCCSMACWAWWWADGWAKCCSTTPGYYFSNPLVDFAVWKGGMSFHGGFLGVLIAMALFARKRNIVWLQLIDFIAPLTPLGLGAGRIGNFINAELWGRPTDCRGAWCSPTWTIFRATPHSYTNSRWKELRYSCCFGFIQRKPRPTGQYSAWVSLATVASAFWSNSPATRTMASSD